MLTKILEEYLPDLTVIDLEDNVEIKQSKFLDDLQRMLIKRKLTTSICKAALKFEVD